VLTATGSRPTCERKVVPVDLTTTVWSVALLQAGFCSHQPSASLLGGFLYYLPGEHIARVLNAITDLAVPGS